MCALYGSDDTNRAQIFGICMAVLLCRLESILPSIVAKMRYNSSLFSAKHFWCDTLFTCHYRKLLWPILYTEYTQTQKEYSVLKDSDEQQTGKTFLWDFHHKMMINMCNFSPLFVYMFLLLQ